MGINQLTVIYRRIEMQTMELTKQDILWERLKHIQTFSSHTVREIGFSIFYDRADRTVRSWAENTRINGFCDYGKLVRIPYEECLLRGLIKDGNSPLAWWEIVG
jgi:hypothetical protein